MDYIEDKEVKIETSFYDASYGCQFTIFYDKTVNDIIFHDVSNSTWNSIGRVYGDFDNSYLLSVSAMLSLKVYRIWYFALKRLV